ncbi:TonB-dependent receptor [Puteibacter caeruleilacunae]|nr:TonB-dependent receptor [Puteibacter caeruleilacunae]
MRNILLLIFFLFPLLSYSQADATEAIITGRVTGNGKNVPFATVSIEGSTLGVSTDADGTYRLLAVVDGEVTFIVRSMGFKSQEKTVVIERGEISEINFVLEKDFLGLEEVIILGEKAVFDRKISPKIINTISAKLFTNTQSISLSEGLNYSPGLRMEINCVNSGFPQLRMNGMQGVYSQILINGRRIFRGIASVFGLEQIPSNMLERVEIIRGGGSVLSGSNSIAGTVDLILKDPALNSYELGVNTGLVGVGLQNTGGSAFDYSLNFNTSVVSDDTNSGVCLYGFYRNRDPFDANDDSFSEIPQVENISLGTRLLHRLNGRNKITVDFFNIHENRRGGNQFEYPLSEAQMAAGITQNMQTGSLEYEQNFKEDNKLLVYLSGQHVIRDAYRGVKGVFGIFDKTEENSYTAGIQYRLHVNSMNLAFGIENDGAWLKNNQILKKRDNTIGDRIKVADQFVNTTGLFTQYEQAWNRFLLSAGLRLDIYDVKDESNASFSNSGAVVSPRITLKYDLRKDLQARFSYAEGYRVPEITDDDLHIEISGSSKIVNAVCPDLKKESSRSYMFSMDFNKHVGGVGVGLLVEGFINQLNDPFVTEVKGPNKEGTIQYIRCNADKTATIKGVNLEFKLESHQNVMMSGGYTFQSSRYNEIHEFGEKKFFRTPDAYGYMTVDWNATKKLRISINSNYTDRMLVPIYGANPELRRTKRFLEIACGIKYNIQLGQTVLQLSSGMKNINNSYQKDFLSGIDRFPGYIYGPRYPRMIYLGVKLGNLL